MALSPDNVQEAFSVIRERGLPSGNRPSTKWDIIDPKTGERFPPKAVLRIAKEVANDTSASGGGGWPTNNPLIELGFEIALKQRLEVSKAASDIEDILKSDLDKTTKQRLVNARLGQGGFREALLEIWNERCAITDCDIKAVLRASHIKAWSDANHQERLDPANGILLAASLDALFDEYLITFTKAGTIRANSSIKKSALEKLGVLAGRNISIEPRTEAYLVWHRQEFDRISGGQSYDV
jgi:HNH endonuclease